MEWRISPRCRLVLRWHCPPNVVRGYPGGEAQGTDGLELLHFGLYCSCHPQCLAEARLDQNETSFRPQFSGSPSDIHILSCSTLSSHRLQSLYSYQNGPPSSFRWTLTGNEPLRPLWRPSGIDTYNLSWNHPYSWIRGRKLDQARCHQEA